MKVTVLGCGPSRGVPMIGPVWGACDPTNPKNRRRRPSIYIENGGVGILVDTSPDLRDQFLDAGLSTADAVLFTHEHADHVMGIDDLRSVRGRSERNIDVYAAADVMQLLVQRFPYLFQGHQSADELYRPVCNAHEFDGPFTAAGIDILPLEQDHGICRSWGFRIGRFAYSTDCVALPEATLAALAGIDTWIVDCLRDGDARHPTHANLEQTRAWVERVQPRRAVLTHMNHQADYEALKAACPEGMEPAYDGMVIEVPDAP
jgi:phosphoribosyl 1,2-cyclic phosphate phosphodiesterase